MDRQDIENGIILQIKDNLTKSILPENVRNAFFLVLDWIDFAAGIETPYMTTNSLNEVTEDWEVKKSFGKVGFNSENMLRIEWKDEGDAGCRFDFGEYVKVYQWGPVLGGGMGYSPQGNLLRTVNGVGGGIYSDNAEMPDLYIPISSDYPELSLLEGDSIKQFNDALLGLVVSMQSAVQNGIKTPTGLACDTNPNYPASTKGDSYKVTVAGKIGGASGPAVEVGDMIICTANNAGGTHASVGSNFFIVQTNLDQATESTVGYAKIATNAQTDTGTDDTTIITPKKLKYHTDGLVHKTGAETIAGVKTFSSIPVLPASNPSTDNQAARKKYVDDTKTKTFTELTDTPANYTGSGGKLVAVNKDANALEFIEAPKANKKMQIALSKRWEDLEANTMAYEFRVLTKMKIEENPIIGVLEAPTGASIKVSIAKNGTFIGVSNPFLEIPAGNLYSTNTHDVKGVTFEKGDKMSFYVNQVGLIVKGQGLDILLEYSE